MTARYQGGEKKLYRLFLADDYPADVAKYFIRE
jgi:hypothetical protein